MEKVVRLEFDIKMRVETEQQISVRKESCASVMCILRKTVKKYIGISKGWEGRDRMEVMSVIKYTQNNIHDVNVERNGTKYFKSLY